MQSDEIQSGNIIATEDGNNVSFSKCAICVSIIIKMIPPPAPNKPFTIPAAVPAKIIFHMGLICIKIASYGFFP
jgi:hypothetical protein